jgi:predicted nucleic acid-binding protein
MILADSSIWIDHLRRANDKLLRLLADGAIVGHPFVTGEIALGSIANRATVVRMLTRLQQLPVATTLEAATFIESSELWGRGIGYVDVHLLASVRLSTDAQLWTRDTRLHAQAERLGIATA